MAIKMSDQPFLLNFWYVGAWVHEVTMDALLPRCFLERRVSHILPKI